MAGIGNLPSFLNPVDAPATETADDRLSIAREDFFKLLITELQTQDPLEPMDNQQFLQQLAQLESLSSQNKMTDGITALTDSIRFSKLNDASSMLGKVVVGTTTRQRFDQEGLPMLDLEGQPVLEDVQVEGLAERVVSQGGELSLVVLSPVIGSDGNIVTDPQGNIVTRAVNLKIETIEEIRDPFISTTPTDG